ncbi:MAG: hypothetical protein WCB27_09745 [Thermoguttaceae bacterium]|jgi:hypothetical protein
MASLGKIKLTSASGEQYRFRVFPLGTRFRSISGVYLISRRATRTEGGHRHKILHVGNSADFSQPFDGYRKAQELARFGANCICVQPDKSAESRREKQRDLAATFAPKRDLGNKESVG